jgi:hypothetical protein
MKGIATMSEYPACTVGDLLAVLGRYNRDALVMIPSEHVGVLVPLGRVITGVHVADACDEMAENVFDSQGGTTSAVALLPDDEEEILPATPDEAPIDPPEFI